MRKEIYSYDNARKISLICPSARANSSLISDKSIFEKELLSARFATSTNQDQSYPIESVNAPTSSPATLLGVHALHYKRRPKPNPRRPDSAAAAATRLQIRKTAGDRLRGPRSRPTRMRRGRRSRARKKWSELVGSKARGRNSKRLRRLRDSSLPAYLFIFIFFLKRVKFYTF